jgi:3-hydroxyisobutyrate dehydrogenase
MENAASARSDARLEERRVGWIGAGKMGAPMIRNLLAHQTRVTVTEPDDAALAGVVASGARAARLADQADTAIVFTTLPNDAVLREVVLGGTGLAGLMRPGATLVEMSTVSPDASAEVAAALAGAGVRYLRAPVSGSTALAEKALLTVLASGDAEGWEAALPYLAMMSQKRFYLGAGDEARYMKLVLNTLVGATSAILAEALALGAQGGLGADAMMEVICDSAVASPLLGYKRAAVVAGDYAPAFTIGQMIKDFTLISDAGRSRGVPLPATSLILETYRAAANAGLRDKDFFALVEWQAKLSAG